MSIFGYFVENTVLDNYLCVNKTYPSYWDDISNLGLGSTIVIRPKSNTLHKPNVQIDGFSIVNGLGSNVIFNSRKPYIIKNFNILEIACFFSKLVTFIDN